MEAHEIFTWFCIGLSTILALGFVSFAIAAGEGLVWLMVAGLFLLAGLVAESGVAAFATIITLGVILFGYITEL